MVGHDARSCPEQTPIGAAQKLDEHHLAIEATEFHLVERIFTDDGREQAEAATIAAGLCDEGHHTRSGRRPSAKVILDILRTRSYQGEASFRDVCHQPEEPLIDPVLIDKAHALLAERGQRCDRRMAHAQPEYLLLGLIVCGHCHRNYVGVAAAGKSHRSRYYVCFSRQRYGKDACVGERIRADVL